jgi:hypothetical protein
VSELRAGELVARERSRIEGRSHHEGDFPCCGYAPSFGLIPSTLGDPIVKSETNKANGSGE